MNMNKNALDLFYDAQKLHKIARWTRRFASLMILGIIFTLLGFGGALYTMLSNSTAYAVLSGIENFWLKSNVVVEGIYAILNFVALYLLLQGLSKIIRYLLNLKTLALNRYQARKTSA